MIWTGRLFKPEQTFISPRAHILMRAKHVPIACVRLGRGADDVRVMQIICFLSREKSRLSGDGTKEELTSTKVILLVMGTEERSRQAYAERHSGRSGKGFVATNVFLVEGGFELSAFFWTLLSRSQQSVMRRRSVMSLARDLFLSVVVIIIPFASTDSEESSSLRLIRGPEASLFGFSLTFHHENETQR